MDITESIRIEAEDYKVGTNGTEYFDTTAGNTGGAYRTDDVDIEVTGDVNIPVTIVEILLLFFYLKFIDLKLALINTDQSH
ncbi:MAG: hypothetical protein GVY04_16965 [Cyanobacteria bacterium]|jgi:hypothetical protein|nr:hypothetical protein [Cyanobacteria bacterium GSL.Bin1]